MKTTPYIVVLLFGYILLSQSCSTKKDAFVNRNMHALTTKYNILYNGTVAFDKGRAAIEANYKDDFSKILPIERLAIEDKITLDSADKNPNFELAEQKATKAIQKHSMNIKGKERNPQMDEAFLLLGKARYFDQRFVPALEAFNYILYKYPNSDKITQAKVWREKVNIRLENQELAIANLKRLFKQETLAKPVYVDALANMAQAYIGLTHIDSAVTVLKKAAEITKDNNQKGRYYYILGQLYNTLEKTDSATFAFNKVIGLHRKSPRQYYINAYIENIKNTDFDANKAQILETLTDLEENRENRPFLDKIYREKARYYFKAKQSDRAIIYFQKSLKKISKNKELYALNYTDLGQLYFENHQYKIAGAYYDSTLARLSENTSIHRLIKKKRDNLQDVISYEDIAIKNDSILFIANLTKAQKQAYFTAVIDTLKQKDLEQKQRAEQSKGASNALFVTSESNTNTTTGFYFYNQITVGYGKTAFRKLWGDRALEDNWRYMDKKPATTLQDFTVVDTTQVSTQKQKQRYTLSYYIDQIPTDVSVIDSIKQKRDMAYYQLGSIYNNKFKEPTLAVTKLEKLLVYQPKRELDLASRYLLYKIYTDTNTEKAKKMRSYIITHYPDSRYATVLENPDAVLQQDADDPDVVYTKLYALYQKQQYALVLKQIEPLLFQYSGTPLVSKLAYLKANVLGKLQGVTMYKQLLQRLVVDYPNTPSAKQAQELLETGLARVSASAFTLPNDTSTWKLVFPLSKQQTLSSSDLVKALKDFSKEHYFTSVKISKDVYTAKENFVVVHGFTTKESILRYQSLLKQSIKKKIHAKNISITSANYKVVQLHKNMHVYIKNQTKTKK